MVFIWKIRHEKGMTSRDFGIFGISCALGSGACQADFSLIEPLSIGDHLPIIVCISDPFAGMAPHSDNIFRKSGVCAHIEDQSGQSGSEWILHFVEGPHKEH